MIQEFVSFIYCYLSRTWAVCGYIQASSQVCQVFYSVNSQNLIFGAVGLGEKVTKFTSSFTPYTDKNSRGQQHFTSCF